MSDCANCVLLQRELDTLRRDGWINHEDLEHFGRDLAGKDLQIRRLQARLNEHEGGATGAGQVKELLDYFVKALGKRSDFDIEPGGKRWDIAKRALKRREAVAKKNGAEDPGREAFAFCCKAIDGLALMPWYSQTRGRTAEKHPGAKKVADVEHALGDEVRMDRCAGYVDEQQGRPEPEVSPEVEGLRRRLAVAERVLSLLVKSGGPGLRAFVDELWVQAEERAAWGVLPSPSERPVLQVVEGGKAA